MCAPGCRPTCAQALIKLPEEQQSIYYMLYGFIATNGAGPCGTREDEREILTRGSTYARLHGVEAPLGEDATAAAAVGGVAPLPSRSKSSIRKSVNWLSKGASSGTLRVVELSERSQSRQLRALGTLMRRGSGWLAGQGQEPKGKHRHHHHHEHKKARRADPGLNSDCSSSSSSTVWLQPKLQPKRARGGNPNASRSHP